VTSTPQLLLLLLSYTLLFFSLSSLSSFLIFVSFSISEQIEGEKKKKREKIGEGRIRKRREEIKRGVEGGERER
jgi:hypothetical protein